MVLAKTLLKSPATEKVLRLVLHSREMERDVPRAIGVTRAANTAADEQVDVTASWRGLQSGNRAAMGRNLEIS